MRSAVAGIGAAIPEVGRPVVAHDHVLGIGIDRADLDRHAACAEEDVALDDDAAASRRIVLEVEIDALAAVTKVIAGDHCPIDSPAHD